METTALATDEARWQAVRARDPQAEGRFVYSVATTGVYCRPTCGARLALRSNVAFHESPAAAERAGFRACKRCRPQQPPRAGVMIAAARRALEDNEAAPRLAALAAAAKLSPAHFHRLFKRETGLTPRAYAAAHRLRRFGTELRAGASATAALHEAGYSSSSRFYESGPGALGATPTELRRGGAGLDLDVAVRTSALGPVLVAATERGVCAILFADRADALAPLLRARLPRATIHEGERPGFAPLVSAVLALIDDTGPRLAPDLPLDLVGTAFQQRVWQALRALPPGTTTTYGALARRMGLPAVAARAVGTACGANPVAVAVPCHRVLRNDGGLGGYRWGLARKRQLLAREAAADRRR